MYEDRGDRFYLFCFYIEEKIERGWNSPYTLWRLLLILKHFREKFLRHLVSFFKYIRSDDGEAIIELLYWVIGCVAPLTTLASDSIILANNRVSLR